MMSSGDLLTHQKPKTSKLDSESYRLPDHWMLPLLRVKGPWALDHEAYVSRAVEIIVQSGARTVLEIGCGDGWNCGKLAEKGLEVTGIDWSVHGIEHAKRMVPNATFMCCDITDAIFTTKFPEGFDAGVLIEVIEHIPPEETITALKNMRKCIRRGGTFVVTTPSTNLKNANPSHFRHFTAETLEEELKAAGFEIKSVEGYGDVPFEAWFWRLAGWVDNRLWTIHPLRDRIYDRYRRRYSRNRPLDRCRGLIVQAQAV